MKIVRAALALTLMFVTGWAGGGLIRMLFLSDDRPRPIDTLHLRDLRGIVVNVDLRKGRESSRRFRFPPLQGDRLLPTIAYFRPWSSRRGDFYLPAHCQGWSRTHSCRTRLSAYRLSGAIVS